MDSRSFALFLIEKLTDKVKDCDRILCSVSYSKIEDGTRLAGSRTTLASLIDAMDGLLTEFYKRNNYDVSQ